eukprot:9831238-Lingulodinium_polyedra.AAC.1
MKVEGVVSRLRRREQGDGVPGVAGRASVGLTGFVDDVVVKSVGKNMAEAVKLDRYMHEEIERETRG